MLQDDPGLIYSSPALRTKRLNELKSLGVDTVKVRVRWNDIASKRPANGADPASYDWSPYDAILSGATARGMGVMFQLGGNAPNWATPGNSLVNNPNAREFGKFVQAAGAHFPSVHTWSVWNEPNLSSWLSPQVSGGVPQSPRIYRGLLRAAQAGLAATGHGNDQILFGELLPFTRSSRSSTNLARHEQQAPPARVPA